MQKTTTFKFCRKPSFLLILVINIKSARLIRENKDDRFKLFGIISLINLLLQIFIKTY